MEKKFKPELIGEARYRNQDGSLSETFAVATAYGDSDWALVRKDIFSSDYQYRYIDGTLSETFYMADPYKFGVALVRKDEQGPKQFRDNNGNLSEPFFNARPYSIKYKETTPLAIVQKEKGGDMQFRDLDGNLSEPFRFIRPYFYGYKVIKKLGDKPTYISLEDIQKSIKQHNSVSTM